MKNGIYLFVVLFLGIMGYFVVNDLMLDKSIMLASILFLVFSVTITMLITHYKKRADLSPAQKVINVLYVGMFAIYGMIVGIGLMTAPTMEMSAVGYEGMLFMLASGILIYGLYVFAKQKLMHHS